MINYLNVSRRINFQMPGGPMLFTVPNKEEPMRLVDFDNIKNIDIFNKAKVIKRATLTNYNDRIKILKAANYSTDIIKKWFNIIGIRFDTVIIEGNTISYIVDNNKLSLTDLSHGERYLLILLALKANNEKVIAESLFEVIGTKLRKVAVKNLADYENLLVITYNAYPPKELLPYRLEEL